MGFQYTRGVLHTFFRVQDRFRCQNLRDETPHLGNAQATAGCEYVHELQRQKEAARLGRVSGLLGQLKTGATALGRQVTSSRFQTHKRRRGKTTGGWHDLANLAMCAALSIFSRISFDRKEVEKRLAPVAQSLRWLSEVIA